MPRALSLPRESKVISIDPVPLPEAEQLLTAHDLMSVRELRERAVGVGGSFGYFDLAFIDGDHTYSAVRNDVAGDLPRAHFVRGAI